MRDACCWCAAQYIRMVRLTGRWTVEEAEILERMSRQRRPFIACFWHGRLMMMPLAFPYATPLSILISRHPDGLFIARTVGHFGFGAIAGSSSKGGGAALRGMLRALAAGEGVAVTPDGPRGPRMRASIGVVRAARLARVPIVPVTFAASRRRLFRSWDRFVLALPFARGIVRVGEPIDMPADGADGALEGARRLLESRLNEMTRELDERLGLPPVTAAPDDQAAAATDFERAGCRR